MPEVTVSKQYRYTVSKLYKDHLDNQITEQELSQRLDELNEEEVKRQEHLGPLFIRQALENIEKDISEYHKQAFEAKIQQEELAQNQQKQKEQAEQRERNKKEWYTQKEKDRKEQEEQRARETEQKRKMQECLSFRETTVRNIYE